MDEKQPFNMDNLKQKATNQFQLCATHMGPSLWLFGAGLFFMGFGLSGLMGAHDFFGSVIALLIGAFMVGLYTQAVKSNCGAGEGIHDVWLSEALYYLVKGTWPDEKRPGEKNSINIELSALMEPKEQLAQIAFEGRITIWGRANHGTRLEKMPANCWRDLGLDLTTFTPGNPQDLATKIITPSVKMMTNPFTYLRTNKRTIEAITWEDVILVTDKERDAPPPSDDEILLA